MWGFLESLGIPANAADGTVALPLWAAAAVAGLLVVLFVLALIRTGLAGTLVFLALVAFGGWAAWSWMEHERIAERRTLEARIAALDTQALAPNSVLACLDGAGDTVEAACERSVFATPEASASGVSYTVGRLALLAEGQNFVARQDPTFDSALDHLRAGLELDRFGFVAHVLALRHGCTPDKCDALRMFRDPNRIRSNLAEKAFDGNLLRAASAWAARPTARGGPAPTNTGVAAPLPPNYNLPSSASIPPVSIMTAEPPAAGAQPPAQAAAPPPAARRPPPPPQRRPPPRPPADSAASPPVQPQPGTARVQ